MKIFLYILTALCCFSSCSSPADKQKEIALPGPIKPSANDSVAYFAAGCFWHTEIVFQSLDAVKDAVSGYAGGHMKNPGYDKVTAGGTGHAETVQVFYDPSRITYERLVDAFFASHDPTTLNRQGNDVGHHYRSIAFFKNEHEKEIIKAVIHRLNTSKRFKNPIVTEVRPFMEFHPAEAFHQEYISRNPGNPYVQKVSIPDFLHFKRVFKADYKP